MPTGKPGTAAQHGTTARYRAGCRCDACRAAVKRYADAIKDRTREHHLRRKFGITEAEYQELLAAQNGVCAICGQNPERIGKTRRLRPAIDHDHATNTIRGVLCHRCNTNLGWFEEHMSAVAHYLLLEMRNGKSSK